MKSFFAQLRSLVLPFGITTGPRILLDGVLGRITAYGTTDTQYAKIDPNNAGVTQISVNATNGGVALMAADPSPLVEMSVTSGSGAQCGMFAGTSSVDISMVLASVGGFNFAGTDFGVNEDGTADHKPQIQMNGPYVSNGVGTFPHYPTILLAGTGVTSTETLITLDALRTLIAGGGKTLDLGGWQTYTPSWLASTTNPTIGNGTMTFRYIYLNKNTVQVDIRIAMGTTTTRGTGNYTFGLPVAAASSVGFGAIGTFAINDSGSALRTGSVVVISTTRIELWINGAGGSVAAATLLGTINGSSISISITYEV